MQAAAYPDLKAQLIALIRAAVAAVLSDAPQLSIELERPKQIGRASCRERVSLVV